MGDNSLTQSVIDKLDELVPTKTVPLTSTSIAYEASRQVKAVSGTLYGISGYNSKGSTQFIQFHDAAALPADTAVPKIIIGVSASSNFSVDFGTLGRFFNNGIVVCNSSTGPTKTIGSADVWFDVSYL